MTTCIKGFWVALERDIREDDAEPLINAVKCLRGVQAVTVTEAGHEDWMARERVRLELSEKLWAALHHKDGGK